MSEQFKLTQKDNPQISYRTSQKVFSLGRSRNCEIVIKDPHISRVQAEVRSANDKYVIKNVGRNPLLINGRPAPERYLKDGDIITLGKINFVFGADKPPQSIAAQASAEEQTVVVTAPQEEAATCRLMIAAADGNTKAVPFDKEKLVLGRSAEADVQLNDPLISRRHCVIERREEGVFARNVSATNPLMVNGNPKTESRLYSGDRLRIGSHSIVFTSNLPADIGQSDETAPLAAERSNRPLWGVTFLLFAVIAGYFGYQYAYRPWQVERTLSAVERYMDVGDLNAAENTLKELFTRSLSKEQAEQARQMLAKSALLAAEKKMSAGDVVGAKKSLSAHLVIHGSGPEAGTLWDRMDYYCIALGKKLEAEGKNEQALRQFAAVRDGSLYQAEARKGISRIWLKYQYAQRQEHTIVELLKEGEAHFAAKRYLTPVNRNAYAVYRAVLVLDGDHVMALKRIDQIKQFYRENGETHFKNQEWAAALGFFERYRIMDPDNEEVAAKIDTCRRRLVNPGAGAETAASNRGGRTQNQQDRQRQDIEQLLESSGTKSAWIMKYLFEEKTGEADTETPW